MISIENIHKKFGDLEVLKGVSLEEMCIRDRRKWDSALPTGWSFWNR